MIRVNKPANKIPATWAAKAADELRVVKGAFNPAKKNVAKLKFKFAAFRDKELRTALNDLFAFKCAYCEHIYGATQPVAIEHFRPKNEVHEGKKKIRPAYYWLAADWTNLFPSCTDCNSRRAHPYPAGEEVRGKGNEFPLRNPRLRARKPGDEKREEPLILDPSGPDDPGKHLEFLTGDDDRGTVRSALLKGKESPFGKESIRVYALDRPGLIRVRRDHAKMLVHQIERTREAAEAHRRKPANAELKKKYQAELDMLKWHLEPQRPFVQMARQLVKKFFPLFKH
jgi:hypothetical protein